MSLYPIKISLYNAAVKIFYFFMESYDTI